MIGKNLLHYRIVAKLGVGGQGEVYEAVNTKLDRTVVIKVLPPELTLREVNLKRFEREARLASSDQGLCPRRQIRNLRLFQDTCPG